MIKFQKNKTQLFECKIKIEGADKSTAKPRLILYPQNDSRNIFFEGTIEDGICKINILPNLSIAETGKAVLEVIVENSILFQPWSTEYEIITEKVKVEEIHVSNSHLGATVKVLEDEVKIDDKKLLPKKENTKPKIKSEVKKPVKMTPKKPKTFDSLLEEAATMIKDEKPENKDKDNALLKAYTESLKSLSKEQLKAMVDYIKTDFSPKKDSLVWAKKALGENISVKSKMLMYCNEIKNKGEIL